jgi:hypothetical protein
VTAAKSGGVDHAAVIVRRHAALSKDADGVLSIAAAAMHAEDLPHADHAAS